MRRTVWIAFLALLASACGFPLHGEQVSFSTIDAGPDWSPDGRLIAFASDRGLGGIGIYVIRPDGSGLRQLFRGVASDVDWSPDGRRLVFVGTDGIYVVRKEGGRPMRVLRGGRFSYPAWAPDGRELAVVKEKRDFTTGVYIVNVDGSGIRRLTSLHLSAASEPTWSPDGHQIAVQSGSDRIVAVRIADGRRRRVTDVESFSPAWSPDGRLIAFHCSDANDLCVANADGSGDVRRVASDGGNPSWAPDSRRIVFDVYRFRGHFIKAARSLSLVNADGTDLQKLTFGPELGPE